jgi:hypothetical protein
MLITHLARAVFDVMHQTEWIKHDVGGSSLEWIEKESWEISL